jgi:hypothetical protein
MADDRAKLRRQLQRHGVRRRQALDVADQALQDIAELLPAALDAGITKTEMQRLTGVSRPTIDSLLRDRH